MPVRRRASAMLIDQDNLAVAHQIMVIALQSATARDRRSHQFIADQTNSPWSGQLGRFIFEANPCRPASAPASTRKASSAKSNPGVNFAARANRSPGRVLGDIARPVGRDQQGRSRLVNQYTVDLVDDCNIKPSLQRLSADGTGQSEHPSQFGGEIGIIRVMRGRKSVPQIIVRDLSAGDIDDIRSIGCLSLRYDTPSDDRADAETLSAA